MLYFLFLSRFFGFISQDMGIKALKSNMGFRSRTWSQSAIAAEFNGSSNKYGAHGETIYISIDFILQF